MPGRPQAIILSMMLSLFVLNEGRTHAQSLPTVRSSRVIEMRTAHKKGYFTVLGQVAKPGVYETSEKKVSLDDVIRRAGGTTANASGSARIYKGTRAMVSVMLPARYVLGSGDIVVVTKKRTYGSTVISPNQYLKSRSDANTQYGIQQFQSKTTAIRQKKQEEHIQLAFVNLVDRPVVVPVREEHANLPAVLMTLLKQRDPAVVNRVRVISGEPRPLQAGQARTELTNGSILVFEKNAVALPPEVNLPKTLQWDANTSNQIATELPGTVTVEEAVASNSTGAMSTISIPDQAAQDDVPTIFSGSDFSVAQSEPSENLRTTDSLPTLNMDQTIVDTQAPESKIPTEIFSGVSEKSADDEVPPPPVLQEENQPNTSIAMAPLSLEESLPLEEPKPIESSETVGGLEFLPTVKPNSSTGQSSSMEVPTPLELVNQDVLPQSEANDLSTVGLLAAFAVVIAVLSVIASAVWSKLDERSGLAESEAPAEATPQLYQPEELEVEAPRQFIQRLIEDTVPIAEEPIEVAVIDSLFGEPVASRTYRVDASHVKESEEFEVPQPHFVNKTQAAPISRPANSEVSPAIEPWEIGSIDSNRYRVDPPDSESMGPSALLDRAKDVIQREKQREHRS